MLEREATHEDLEDFRRIGLVTDLVIFGAWLLRSWLAKRWPSLLVGRHNGVQGDVIQGQQGNRGEG